jgi:hypothetical protein
MKTYHTDGYTPETAEKLAAMLTELSDAELLALVPDTKHKSAQGKQLLLDELKKRISPICFTTDKQYPKIA